jgi:hypothetical protein
VPVGLGEAVGSALINADSEMHTAGQRRLFERRSEYKVKHSARRRPGQSHKGPVAVR